MVIKAEKEWNQITLKAMCPEISGGSWYLLLHLSKIPEVDISRNFFLYTYSCKKNVRNLRSYIGSEAELEFEGWKSIFFIICQPAPQVNWKRWSYLFVGKMECCNFLKHCKHCTGVQHHTNIVLTHQPPSFTHTILTHSFIYLPTHPFTYIFNVLGRCLEHPTEWLQKNDQK